MYSWENIIIGLQLAIIIQLIAIGILNIFQRKTQYILLGVFCILIANLIIFYINLNELKQYKILYFFIGGSKNLFYGPLLFLYLKSINQKKMKKLVLFHLIFPGLIYIVSIIKYHFISDMDTKIVLTYIDLFSFSILVLVYYVLGIKEYRENLKLKLKEKSKNRYLLFYYTANGYLLISVFLLIGSYLFLDWGNNFYSFLSQYNTAVFHNYISIPIFLLFCISLIIYGLTELKWIKRLIPKQVIFEDKDMTFDNVNIEKQMTWLFEEEKVFKNPDLTLDFLSHKIGIKQNVIRHYLKKIKNTTFSNFINEYRIKDFKENLIKKEYQNYDLTGIALESGFKSRASFYRIFKGSQGMTPGDYKKDVIK